ncbi:MAG: hypothetical protein JHC89_13995, partial [Acetobacteraceae bacterium]|nr:hypothetical protein [Acetobacteraceae bacterium]
MGNRHGAICPQKQLRHGPPDNLRTPQHQGPRKDVDGFHPLNAGRLAAGEPGLVPCTPRGVMHLLAEAGVTLRGARALVLGRSQI